MMGPGGTSFGGMTSVASTLNQGARSGIVNFRCTFADSGGGRGRKGYTTFPSALGKALTRPYDVMHLHVASRGSTVRKVILSLCARVRRRPYVLHVHGGGYEEFVTGLGTIPKAVVTSFFRRAAAVIVLGERWRDMILRLGSIEESHVHVVPNGVRGVPRRGDASKEHDRYVVFVGGVTAAKGADVLLKAWAGLHADLRRGWRCVLVGQADDPRIMFLVNSVNADRPQQIVFLGTRFGLEKDDIVSKASVFVMPSRVEALPVTLLEAMSAGLPSIASDVGSVAEVVEDGVNGLIVPAGDPAALQRALERLMAQQPLRLALGSAAFCAWDKRYTEQNFVKNVGKVWASVVDADEGVGRPQSHPLRNRS